MKPPSKSRPDRTKSVRRPASLELSPPSEEDHATYKLHEDIPWAEIIIDPEPGIEAEHWVGEFSSWPEHVPPLPVLLGLLVVFALVLW